MSLYYEAASFINGSNAGDGSIRFRVYANKSLKSNSGHIYALLSEATRWSSVLSPIIEKAGILQAEKKLTPVLALLLTHDLLLAKRGVAAPKDHVLALAIHRHKARLSAEFTRERIRCGHASSEAWKRALGGDSSAARSGPADAHHVRFHPRWVRVNQLKSSLEKELGPGGVFYQWTKLDSLDSFHNLDRSLQNVYVLDKHIPNLVATPPNTDLTSTKAYKEGRIILQDKASCFPAYLLDPAATKGDMIDGCAAPGNKTTHLAALTKSAQEDSGDGQPWTKRTIYAVERDEMRSKTLQRMVHVAGASDRGLVKCLGKQDFSKLKPRDYAHVEAILLDPSCSGSGIVGRDVSEEAIEGKLQLPGVGVKPAEKQRWGKRAKGHGNATQQAVKEEEHDHENENENDTQLDESGTSEATRERLLGLASFQCSLLVHAFRFPAARRIVYSTCSVHAEENEGVVLRALASPEARAGGWTILARANQVAGMQAWHARGDVEAVRHLAVLHDANGAETIDVETVGEACIRCHKAGADGTMGFFAAAFVRVGDDIDEAPDDDDNANDGDEDEFEGFGDNE